MSQFFTSGGQYFGISASTSVLPMNTQDWFPLEWTGWISLQFKGFSRVFSDTTQFISINSALSFLYSPTLTSTHTTGKTIALTRWTFVGKVMSLLFTMLSRLIIAFLPRSMQASFNFMAASHHLQWFWNPRSAFPNPCQYQERPRESEQVNNYSIQKKRAYLISLALDI